MPTLSLRTRLALAAGTLALVVLTAGAALAKPVAIVNGIDVPESDFAATLRAEAGRVVLTHMLGNAIIKDAFDKAGLTVSQKDLHDALVARFGSVERFKETATTNQVDEALYFSQVLTPQIMLEKLATQGVKTDDASLRAYYEANRNAYDTPEKVTFRIIVVANAEDAAKVLASLKTGQDFAAAAQQFSLDPGTKTTGGLVPDAPVNMLPAPIATELAKLKEGQISAPVTTPGAVFLLRLDGRLPGRSPSFEELKAQLAKDLLQSKRSQEALASLRAQLIAAAKVQIIAPDMAGAAKDLAGGPGPGGPGGPGGPPGEAPED